MTEEPILLVEDNPDDLALMMRALKRAQVANPVHTVTTGGDAIRYLKGEGQFADRKRFPLPYLILLDLKLPEVPGLEVLQWIRTNLDFAVVVVVLSSSAEAQDVITAAKRHCNSYLVKPDSLQELYDLAALIKAYWIDRNQWIREPQRGRIRAVG
jgi:CheY-like chemotaxis protein